MTYSILAVLHPYANKEGLQKVLIQVIYKRHKVYAPTIVKVSEKYWKDGAVIKHELKNRYNGIIHEQRNEIEKRLLDALHKTKDLPKEQLSQIAKGESAPIDTTEDFIYLLMDELSGRLTEGRLKHYKGMAEKIKRYSPGVKLASVNVQWMQRFEAHLRALKLDGNTIQANMSLMKGVLNKAHAKGLVEKKQYELYKVPLYKQKLPDYITEDEMNKLFDLVQAVSKPAHKLAGYYFLLSCYTGYRIGDSKSFIYKERVKEGKIILRAKKNGSIVSIPIHTRLQKVLDYIKERPLDLSEQKVREYVKELCSLAGIKPHKYHNSRHGFAMLLMTNGFTIDEVSELIGDTLLVSKVYARVHNEGLSKKIMERLG